MYSGRPRGVAVRQAARLDAIDDLNSKVLVKVPRGTWSLNASFFHGLFGPSIARYPSRESFLEKYEFDCSPQITEDVEVGINDALRSLRRLKLLRDTQSA